MKLKIMEELKEKVKKEIEKDPQLTVTEAIVNIVKNKL